MSDIVYPLGKLPARENAYSFKLMSYVATATAPLPIAPAVFGHQDLITNFGMLANDQYGDCVWAGAAHETMLWTAESGTASVFSDSTVLDDYAAVTGFTRGNPNSDQGTDMEAAAKYRRKTGILDTQNKRHVVDAYLELPGVSPRSKNVASVLIPTIASSTYIFGAVGLGIEFPSAAMQQFNRGLPWSVVPGSSIEGGHYVPVVGRRANGNFLVVTWGRLQEVTPEFIATYADEAVVYISLEQVAKGKNLHGFDVAALRADLDALAGKTPVAPVIDPNVAILNEWASKKRLGENGAAVKAWNMFKSTHNIS